MLTGWPSAATLPSRQRLETILGRIYILAEHDYKAYWVQNVMGNPAVQIRINTRQWKATGRVLDAEQDAGLYMRVRELARTKYGWGNGLLSFG